MKCDELKSLKNIEIAFNTTTQQEQVIAEDSEGNCYGFDSWEEVYLKDEVDAAIAELKQKLQDQCISCPVKMQEDDVVAELKQILEDAKATAYAESVDEGMRERRMKRALWLARAKRAEARKNYWYVRSIHEGDKNLWSIDGSAVKYIGCIKRVNFDWLKIWSEVECKCGAKAEEYK